MKLRFFLSGGKKQEDASDSLPLVIFSDDKRYWNVFEPVCRELDKRGVDVTYMTASEDDRALQCDLPHVRAEFIGEGNRAFAKLNLLKADVLLSTTPGLDVYQWKRSPGVKYYIHILHMANDVTTYRMFGLDYYDAVMLSGEYQAQQIRKLEKLRKLPGKELVMTGIPYMDEMAKRLASAQKAENSVRTVLVAPSWGKSSIFGKFGGKVIDELLKTDYHIVIRPHPQSFKSEKELMERLMAEYPESDRLEWNRDADNFDVLNRSDIMISDFSGVVFDFALVFDKPVIYANTEFDNSPYEAWWLEEPLWTFSALPRLGEELTEERMPELGSIIEKCLSDTSYAAGRRSVREETWCNYGGGACAAADYIEQKLKKCKEMVK